MSTDVFLPVAKKIERAQLKVKAVNTEIASYVFKNPISVRSQLYDGRTFYISRVVNDPPEIIAWEAIEAIGHLRGALDKLVVTLVEKNGRGTSGVGFPFPGTTDGIPDVFPSKSAAKIKSKLTDAQWDIFVSANPSSAGNFPLWSINELANIDKHKIGLVGVSTRIGGGTAINDGTVEELLIGPSGYDFLKLPGEEILYAVKGADPGAVESTAYAEVRFGAAGRANGYHVDRLLNAQINAVQDFLVSARDVVRKF